MSNAIVVGAGVSGLSCAIGLAEAGFTVRVLTRDAPKDTTSAIAAAIWYPFHAEPRERLAGWGRVTLEELIHLSAEPGTGIRVLPGVELTGRAAIDPWWASGVPGFREARPDEVPPGRTGHAMELPAVDMPVYLEWLRRRLLDLGGVIEMRELKALDEALAMAPIVVNCAGMAARELLGDAEVYAARGQVVHVRAPEIDRFIMDNYGPDGMTYVIPRTEVVVCGGTSLDGVEDLDVDDATTAAILERAGALEPRVRGAEVVNVEVGLRPCRSTVRLEAETRDGGLLVHNYGHGGSGVTLSWGCAAEVLELCRTAA